MLEKWKYHVCFHFSFTGVCASRYRVNRKNLSCITRQGENILKVNNSYITRIT